MKPAAKKLPTTCTSCPIAKVVALFGDHCSVLIVRDLMEGPRRFTDLVTSLSPISSRTITKKLQQLEAVKIITRTEYRESPPRVEYSLTKEGKKLLPIITAMRKYGEEYL